MPEFQPDYLSWATDEQVITCLDAAGVTLRDAGKYRIARIRNAVVQEIGKATNRQFVADTMDQTRIYNGTGTSEIEVDEMVSLTSVAVIGYESVPAYSLSNAILVFELTKPMTRIVVGRGSLVALNSEGILFPYPQIFPSGRQNIQVTGKFGYGATIPSDLWEAVCEEIALRCASDALHSPEGRLTGFSFSRQAVWEQFQILPVETALLWHKHFLQAKVDYKRPVGRRMRNTRPEMI